MASRLGREREREEREKMGRVGNSEDRGSGTPGWRNEGCREEKSEEGKNYA